MGNKKRKNVRVLFIPGELRTTVTAARGLRTGHNGLALTMVMEGGMVGKTRVISCYNKGYTEPHFQFRLETRRNCGSTVIKCEKLCAQDSRQCPNALSSEKST